MDRSTAESLLSLAEQAAPRIKGVEAKATLSELEERSTELLEAIEWFVDQQRTDDALRLANALYGFWITKQRFDEGSTWFTKALASPDGIDSLRGAAYVNAGFMPFWAGDDERAAELFHAGLEIGRRLDDAPLISRALGGLVRVALRSDVAEARRLAREALAISEAAGDEQSRSNAIHLLGVGAQIAGDLDEARTWMTQRLAIVREQGNLFLISSEAANLSMVERQLGNLDAAEALVREALEIAERQGDEFTKPFAFSGLAAIATDRADYHRATTLVGAAERIMETQGAAWPPDERPHYERMLAVLPEAMGSAAFEEARVGGQAMESGDAVKYALAGHPNRTIPTSSGTDFLSS
jgi:tetratricopeptide (TPR) repeat protein